MLQRRVNNENAPASGTSTALVGKTNMVKAVQTLIAKQSRMEEAQLEFFKYQTHLNTLTHIKTENLLVAQQRLENQIMAGRAAMVSLHNQLEHEGTRIDELKTDVEQAEQELCKVNDDLAKLEQVVKQQSAQLSKQGQDISSLAHSNKQREAIIECFILLVCTLVVRNLPLQTLLFVLPSKSLRSTSSSVVRLAVFVFVLKKIRQHTTTLGWTSGGDLNLLDHIIRMQQQQ